MGEESWEKDLGLEKKRRGPMAWRKEKDGRMGRLKDGFSTKRKSPWDLAKNYKFALGSTLGVDSWLTEIQKNDEIIFKKFKTLGEGYLLNDQL